MCLVVLAVSLAGGCATAPGENAPAENRPPPPDPPPAAQFDGDIAGRRGPSLSPLTREQYERYAAGVAALADGDAAGCVAWLQPLIDVGRDDEWLLNHFGSGLLESGRPAAALEVFYRGLQLYPDNGYLHLNTARALDGTGDRAGAIPHYRAFLDSDLTREKADLALRACVALAENLLEEGRTDDAAAVMDQGREQFLRVPVPAVLLELQAWVAWVRGDQEQFVRLAREAAEAFDGKRQVAREGGEPELPPLLAEGEYAWPLSTAAMIRRAPGQEPGHVGARQRYAVALLPLDDKLQARPDGVPLLGSAVEQWAGFGADVLAARDGVVVRAVDRWPDQPLTGVSSGEQPTPANHVWLRHAGGEFSEYTHLKAGSLRVKTGDRVAAGQVLASVGCSGVRPIVPHLGFRVFRQTPDGLNPGLSFGFEHLEQQDAGFDTWSPLPPGEWPTDCPLRRHPHPD